jgi:hypothetical protein
MSRSVLHVLLRVLLHAATTAAESPRLNREASRPNSPGVISNSPPKGLVAWLVVRYARSEFLLVQGLLAHQASQERILGFVGQTV